MFQAIFLAELLQLLVITRNNGNQFRICGALECWQNGDLSEVPESDDGVSNLLLAFGTHRFLRLVVLLDGLQA
jgi:hypothetical protein